MAESISIIIATNGSENAIDAARRSMDLLRPNAHIEVVMVIPEHENPQDDAGGFEGPVMTDKEADEDWNEWNAAGKSALDRTAAVLGPDVEVRLFPDNESPGAALVRVANETNADVLVIGSSDKNWFNRHFGGSVSDYVAHHAPCPVMLVPHDR
jgi:nucleotide-binding universal stress UspA family protein